MDLLFHIFADDLILLGKATVQNARVIKQVIDLFCEKTGLNLNLAKSKVFFSKSNGAGLMVLLQASWASVRR